MGILEALFCPSVAVTLFPCAKNSTDLLREPFRHSCDASAPAELLFNYSCLNTARVRLSENLDVSAPVYGFHPQYLSSTALKILLRRS